jgi:hypothetical protein
MGATTSSQKLLGIPELDLQTAEWYPLYTVSDVDEDTVTEMGHFLLLLFFSVAQIG